MTTDIATGATWQINCSARAGGNKRIRRVESAEVSDERNVTAVSEVGPGEMVGFQVEPGSIGVTFNIRETIGAKAEIDWYYLRDSGEEFSLTRQVVRGRRRQLPVCMVANISESDSDKGEIKYTVQIVALDRKSM